MRQKGRQSDTAFVAGLPNLFAYLISVLCEMFKILQKQHFFVEIVEMQIVITQCVKKLKAMKKEQIENRAVKAVVGGDPTSKELAALSSPATNCCRPIYCTIVASCPSNPTSAPAFRLQPYGQFISGRIDYLSRD